MSVENARFASEARSAPTFAKIAPPRRWRSLGLPPADTKMLASAVAPEYQGELVFTLGPMTGASPEMSELL